MYSTTNKLFLRNQIISSVVRKKLLFKCIFSSYIRLITMSYYDYYIKWVTTFWTDSRLYFGRIFFLSYDSLLCSYSLVLQLKCVIRGMGEGVAEGELCVTLEGKLGRYPRIFTFPCVIKHRFPTKQGRNQVL